MASREILFDMVLHHLVRVRSDFNLILSASRISIDLPVRMVELRRGH